MSCCPEPLAALRACGVAVILVPFLALAVAPASAYEEKNAFDQPEIRDATGKITVEASTVHVINCTGLGENGGSYYVYEYLNRPGFRAILPPEWGKPLGGKDFDTFAEAVQAACAIPSDTGAGGIVDGGAATRGGYVGCFKDEGKRDLNRALVDLPDNSPQACIQACYDQGYAFAGLQYGTQCYCGVTYGKYGAAENCDTPCPGDALQTCGGTWANDVWSTGYEGGAGVPGETAPSGTGLPEGTTPTGTGE